MLSFQVEKRLLLDPLSKVQGVVDKKTTMNIINNVLLYTDENDRIYLEATDLEISYKASVSCSVGGPGSITVNAKKFYELLREMPTDTILVEELPDYWLRIRLEERGEYKIAGLPPENFPRFQYIETSSVYSVEGALLKELLERTAYAASTDESKYALSGVLIEKEAPEEGGAPVLRAVASDGHRLALAEREVEGLSELPDLSALVPRKGALEMKRVLGSAEEVEFTADERFWMVRCGDEALSIRLLESAFPNYKAILPKEEDSWFEVSKAELLGILRRVTAVSPESSARAVKIQVRPGEMEIEPLFKELGDARERGEAVLQGTDALETALNAKYVGDALSVMRSDRVRFTKYRDGEPVIVTGEEDPGYLALIMPISLRGAE